MSVFEGVSIRDDAPEPYSDVIHGRSSKTDTGSDHTRVRTVIAIRLLALASDAVKTGTLADDLLTDRGCALKACLSGAPVNQQFLGKISRAAI